MAVSEILVGATPQTVWEVLADPHAYRAWVTGTKAIRGADDGFPRAGTSLYHQGSADVLDGELTDGPVDIFLAGIAGRAVTPRYWERILPRLDPRVVVPTHYDNFFAPLGRRLSFVSRVKLAQVPAEVAAVSRDALVVALPRIDEG